MNASVGVVKAVPRLLTQHAHPQAAHNISHEGAPLRQCGRASLFVDAPTDEMALLTEMVVDLSVN